MWVPREQQGLRLLLALLWNGLQAACLLVGRARAGQGEEVRAVGPWPGTAGHVQQARGAQQGRQTCTSAASCLPEMDSLAHVGSSGSTPVHAPASWPSLSARLALLLACRSCAAGKVGAHSVHVACRSVPEGGRLLSRPAVLHPMPGWDSMLSYLCGSIHRCKVEEKAAGGLVAAGEGTRGGQRGERQAEVAVLFLWSALHLSNQRQPVDTDADALQTLCGMLQPQACATPSKPPASLWQSLQSCVLVPPAASLAFAQPKH